MSGKDRLPQEKREVWKTDSHPIPPLAKAIATGRSENKFICKNLQLCKAALEGEGQLNCLHSKSILGRRQRLLADMGGAQMFRKVHPKNQVPRACLRLEQEN